MELSHNPDTKTQPEVETVSPSIPGTQPDPPEELSSEEGKEWRRFWLVAPPDWFPLESWPMLCQLCRHICQSRWVGQCLQEVRAGLLDPTDDDALERVERLQRLHDREGRAMTALMVRLRLTSQQRIPDADVADRNREKANREHVDVQPWMAPKREDRPGRPQ